MTESTSTTLLEHLVDISNAEAWARFAELYRPMFVAYAVHRGLQESDAQDVAQEAVISVTKAHPNGKYVRSKGRFRDWLMGIASNKVADHYRKAARLPQQVSDGSKTDALDHVIDSNDLANDLWNEQWEQFVLDRCMECVVREFGQEKVDIFRRFSFQGEPASVVAESMNVSPDVVYQTKARVLKRMREVATQLELAD